MKQNGAAPQTKTPAATGGGGCLTKSVQLQSANVAVLADSQAQHSGHDQNASDQDNSGVVAGGLDDAAGSGGHGRSGSGGRFVNMPVAVLVLVGSDVAVSVSRNGEASGNSLAVDGAGTGDGAVSVDSNAQVLDGDAIASQSVLDDVGGVVGVGLDI